MKDKDHYDTAFDPYEERENNSEKLMEKADYLADERRDRMMDDMAPNNRAADGRVCNCEDAPCCGHYES